MNRFIYSTKLFLLLIFVTTLSSCNRTDKESPVREVRFHVVGMDCVGCLSAVNDRLHKIDGIQSVRVTLDDSLAILRIPENKTPSIEELTQMLEEMGYGYAIAEGDQ